MRKSTLRELQERAWAGDWKAMKRLEQLDRKRIEKGARHG
jgi:hypothetical protein